MRALWLVEDCVISCYNHPARDDYNTEALIFKMATARFFDVSEVENERKFSCSDNHLSNYTKPIIVQRLSEYCRKTPSTSSRGNVCARIQNVINLC